MLCGWVEGRNEMEAENIVLFVCIGLGMFAVIGGLAMLSNYYTLNGIKSRTVGDGQHGKRDSGDIRPCPL